MRLKLMKQLIAPPVQGAEQSSLEDSALWHLFNDLVKKYRVVTVFPRAESVFGPALISSSGSRMLAFWIVSCHICTITVRYKLISNISLCLFQTCVCFHAMSELDYWIWLVCCWVIPVWQPEGGRWWLSQLLHQIGMKCLEEDVIGSPRHVSYCIVLGPQAE